MKALLMFLSLWTVVGHATMSKKVERELAQICARYTAAQQADDWARIDAEGDAFYRVFEREGLDLQPSQVCEE